MAREIDSRETEERTLTNMMDTLNAYYHNYSNFVSHKNPPLILRQKGNNIF